MNPEMHTILNQRFARGKEFITTRGTSLLEELTDNYKEELWQYLREHAILAIDNKIAVDIHLDIDSFISRQVTFLWALGYAIGSAGLESDSLLL